MICAISPSQSCKNETLSTLRFAQRAKAIKNKATINEIRQDDVNVLREQIRQLKDELLRMKSNGSSVESNGSYSTGWNARRSLSLLRMSLNCPTVVPVTKDDGDVEMEIDENDVERSHIHANPKSSSHEEPPVQSGSYKEEDKSIYYNKTISGIGHSIHRSQSDNGSNDGSSDSVKCRDLEEVVPSQACSKNDAEICSSMDHNINKSLDNGPVVHVTNDNILPMPNSNKVTDGKSLEEKVYVSHGSTLGTNSAEMSNADPSNNASGCVSSIMSQVCLDNMPCQTSPELNLPTLSVSPIAESQGEKGLRTSSAMPSSQNNKLTNSDLLALSLSFAENSNSNPSKAPRIQKRKDCTAPNDRLAASLHHGLQIIDNLQHNSALRMSAFRFSMRPNDLKPVMHVNKVDVGVQTLQESETEVSTSLCRFCKNKASESEHQDVDSSKDLQLVTDDETLPMDNATKQLPKAVEKVLAGAIRREMALEYRCRKQDAEIVQLGRLVQQYKHERECNAIIVQTCEDKIARLESLMDDILPTEEFMDAEFISLTNEHKILKGKYENHPEILRVNIELKRALDELDGYKNFFDLGERDVLMEEIQDLRTQLQYYTNSSLPTHKLSQVHRFTPANHFVANPVSTIAELAEESSDKKLEKEGSHTGNDSKLISLIEELRLELEASRCLAEKQKLELDTEKKCAEELKEALQIAMQGHARILEQYADLQEKNIELLRRHRKISDGIEDVKRAAVRAGVKGPESRFINSLATEISALRVEREKERRYWTDENKGLRAQLRDTAEAVQAAGELLVRLKEAEEALALAQKRALVAEDETEKAYQEIDRLKENYDREIITLNKLVEEAHSPNDTRPPAPYGSDVEFDLGEEGEFSKGTDPSLWYSGYDRCNM
ncbi:kinesin-like protein KIN-12B [Iris pallida]|uniref:Kinesin-like protein KIN-12B n=1 Tax=Iris pallida TaxID=29817 RepID=A0AAX6HVB7_IRIPA|nr:kinesin-like protein KIN-12B [Iris pallida]